MSWFISYNFIKYFFPIILFFSTSNLPAEQLDYNITEKFYLENRWGEFNYLEIGVNSGHKRVFVETSLTYFHKKNNEDLSYTINGNAFFVREENGVSYYGLFIPFNLYDKISSYTLKYSVYTHEIPIFIKTAQYEVQERVWARQDINFTPSQSSVVQNSSLSVYNEQNAYRHTLWAVRNARPFFLKGFIHPVGTGNRVSSAFGLVRRWVLSDGTVSMINIHNGIDYPKPTGNSVFAVTDGVVCYAKMVEYMGNMIIIDHGFGIYTDYSHLNSINVSEGQYVNKGDIIGTIGATGTVTGPHLHWGMRLNNFPLDPERLFILNEIIPEINITSPVEN